MYYNVCWPHASLRVPLTQPRAQTVPRPTLLVNSKTPREAILHPTLKGQRDRDRYVEPCTPTLLEIQQLRLNQQSHGFLYIYAECSRLCPESAPKALLEPRTEGGGRQSLDSP